MQFSFDYGSIGDKCLVLAIGNFDGVHKGHQVLINRLLSIAKKKDLQPAVLTFEPHTRRVLQPKNFPKPIYTYQQKAEVLASFGVSVVIHMEFNANTAALSPENFIDELKLKLNVNKIVCGENFHFGSDGSGSANDLKAICFNHGIDLEIVPMQSIDANVVSSSIIRKCIENNDFISASNYLGRAYAVAGYVAKGDNKGHSLGFPTINIDTPDLVLNFGIYAAFVKIKGKTYLSAMSYGRRPTMGNNLAIKAEAFIFDYNQNLYGQWAEIIPFKFIRNESKFKSLDELKIAINNDVNNIKTNWETWEKPLMK